MPYPRMMSVWTMWVLWKPRIQVDTVDFEDFGHICGLHQLRSTGTGGVDKFLCHGLCGQKTGMS
ncbi:hypothetical protein [uncultured Methanolobus sp.]|uniref:hypothetical protein n=1 Tax=uncultured Methanolobus sp. TaxID=218300 RepID=UPI0029C644E4|nr:hypothetical protein [uncultured Methanolobus sp.]